MVLQSSMGKFKLDVRYGDRNALPYYNGALASDLLGRTGIATEATAGKVYTRQTNGALTVGLTDEGTVPYFGVSGMDANNYPDTQRDRGMPAYLNLPTDGIGAPGSPGWPNIALRAVTDNPAGGFATIQHFAAAELSTTAFVLDDDNDDSAYAFKGLIGSVNAVTSASYTPGTALTALATGAGGVAAASGNSVGLLCPVQAATDVIVGYVTAPIFTGPEGYYTLAFSPTYVAGTTVAALTAANTLTDGAANIGPLA